MINVVAYARFSSDNQRTESIDAQIRAIQDYCDKNNFNLINIYKDEAISGTSTEDREQFLEMIEDSKNKNFKYVIVHKFDRFARNRYDHALYEKKLEDNGTKLLSVLEQLNDSPESVILKSVLTGMNEYYSLNLAREVKKGQKENALKCIHNGGIPPLGYDLNEDKTYRINNTESEAVNLIFKMYLDGRGYATIADELNSQGYVNKLGKPFRKTSIRDTLLNEKYTGIFTFGKKDKNGKLTGNELRIENGIPAIISKEVFEQVQFKIKSRQHRKTSSRSTAKTTYLLTGLCVCGECGGTFSGGYRNVQRNGIVNYGYLCRQRKDKVSDCKNFPIVKEKLEALVINAVKENIFTSTQIDIISNKVISYINENLKTANKNINKIEKEITALTKKSDKLLDLNLNGIISDNELKNKKGEIDMEIFNLKQEKSKYSTVIISTDKQKIKNHLIELGKNLDSKDEFLIKNILQTFVQKVTIYKHEITIKLRVFPLVNMAKDGGDDGNRTRVQNKKHHKLLQVYSAINLILPNCTDTDR